MSRIVIFGATRMAAVVHYYLTHDSPHEVVAFTVDRAYLQEESFCELPVVPFEDIESTHPPSEHEMFVALGFRSVNATRAQKFAQARKKGYRLISYVSSRARTWPDLTIGDNCMIAEGSLIGPFARIGDDVIVAGGKVGHHSEIQDHCFLAGGSLVLGGATIEPRCTLGAGCIVRHGVTVGRECVIGMGVAINHDVPPKGVYVAPPPERLPKPSDELSGFLAWFGG